MIYIDRSRWVTYQHCPRKYWLSYEDGGMGWERAQTPIALGFGIVIHQALAQLLNGEDIEAVIQAAMTSLKSSESFAIDLYGQADLEAVMGQQRTLAEGIIRAWQATQLPHFEGRVVDTEREETVEIVPGITLMARADALIRHADGLIYLHNFKTVSSPDARWEQQWQLDTATLAEVLAVEARLGEKLGGVVIEGIVKGRKETLDNGWQVHRSPFTDAWHNSMEFTEAWAARYAWKDQDGKGHRLGKGWARKSPNEYPGGQKAWIAHLLATDDALVKEQFKILPPILRSAGDVEEWKKTIVKWVETREASSYPKYSDDGNCTFPSRCQFYDVCWGTGATAAELGFKQRTPNHPQEK